MNDARDFGASAGASARDRLRAAATSLVDADYYRSCYDEELGDGDDPVDHFLRVGLGRGFKPNREFDPIVASLWRPSASFGDAVLHAATSPETLAPDLSVASAMWAVKRPVSYPPHGTSRVYRGRDDRDFVDAAQVGQARSIKVPFAGKTYTLQVPEPGEIWARFADDRPFAVPRLPHGFWDGLLVLQLIRAQVQTLAEGRDLSDDHVDRLASRLCGEFYPRLGLFSENVSQEARLELEAMSSHPDLIRSVAFKGDPSSDERLFGQSKEIDVVDEARLRIFASYFEPGAPLLDAMLWKRWLISGDLKQLPRLLRDHPVIFVGPKRLDSLGRRWELPDFEQIVIPPEGSQALRYSVLAQCRRKLTRFTDGVGAKGAKRPVFLFQGGSFAYWLIVRLFRDDPTVFYIDLGQAPHAWFLDVGEIPLLAWTRTIFANCGLGSVYRDLGITLSPLFQERGEAQTRPGAGAATEVFGLPPPYRTDGGFAWLADLPASRPWPTDDNDHHRVSPLRLLEDGQEIGLAHVEHAFIRAEGGGYYSFWDQNLYFSTPDQSDPNTNGRRYEFVIGREP